MIFLSFICKAANFLDDYTNEINDLPFTDDQVLISENETECSIFNTA